MTRRIPIHRIPVLAGALLACLSASSARTDTSLPAYKNPRLPVEERVSDLLSRMTLEEKVRQLDMYGGLGTLLEREQFDMPPHFGPKGADIHAPNPEGIFTGDPTHAKADAKLNVALAQKVLGDLGVGCLHDVYPRPKLYNEIQKWVIGSNRLGIPALIFEEGLHGYMQFDQTLLPQSINLSSTWSRELARKTGAAIAAEARANGVHMILGPVLDLARDARWGRIEETFGEDPYLTGQLGLQFVEGMQGKSLADDNAVIAEPKHFAGHGSPESGLNTSPAHLGEREMRSLMLKSFEPAVREGNAMGIMAAYHDIDGLPVTANPWLLNQVLRDEWGFRGIVVADASAIRRLEKVHQVAPTMKDAVCLALNSGVDVQFLDYPNVGYQRSIIEGVKGGEVLPATLDAAVSRVLRAKFALGLFDRPFVDENLDAKVRRCPEHLALSLEVARQSLCLLKNDGGLLPLDASKLKSIAVIGPNANISRNGCYAEYAVESPEGGILEAVRKLAAPSTEIMFDPGKDIPAAVEVARKADVVILGLGEKQGISGENFDRLTLDLPGNQQELIEAVVATGKPVVLVLLNGRPLSITWAAEHVPSILEAWYPAEFGGRAIAETLFGQNNPSGKLTVSFPKHVGQVPVNYNHFPSKNKNYVEGDMDPLFVFGHGLSYTTFRYSDLKVSSPKRGTGDDVELTFTLENTGKRAGTEVVQAYVRKPFASVATPVKALKAFDRVALEPGEKKTVTLRIKQDDLAIWNAKGVWQIEPGKYVVSVGGSSGADMTATFEIPKP
jgi:beta-glucosidase